MRRSTISPHIHRIMLVLLCSIKIDLCKKTIQDHWKMYICPGSKWAIYDRILHVTCASFLSLVCRLQNYCHAGRCSELFSLSEFLFLVEHFPSYKITDFTPWNNPSPTQIKWSAQLVPLLCDVDTRKSIHRSKILINPVTQGSPSGRVPPSKHHLFLKLLEGTGLSSLSGCTAGCTAGRGGGLVPYHLGHRARRIDQPLGSLASTPHLLPTKYNMFSKY